jgi:hypothetical protein
MHTQAEIPSFQGEKDFVNLSRGYEAILIFLKALGDSP